MNKLNKIKNIFSTREDVNSILNVSIRLGVSGIIIIVIIIIWSYFILKVSRSFVENESESLWNYIDLFCASQITPPPQPPTQPGDSIQCTGVNVEYKCDGSTDSYPPGYTISNDICLNSEQIDGDKSWCDMPGLSNMGVDGIPNTILTDKIRYNCCVDNESNINYSGLIIYFIITGPIIYMLIDKIFNKFIFVEKTEEDNGKQFYNLIDTVLGGKGSLIIIFILICYFILFPVIRYFIVSYRCEGVSLSNDPNCKKRCSTDDDCITVNNSQCSSCISNICSNPEAFFSDYDTNVHASGLSISVCGIGSILDHLKEQEINGIYNKFIQPLNPGVIITDKATQITSIRDHLIANPQDNGKITSYYYRFYPRQELLINDTLTPFRVRIPNPSITGYDYLLNNFIQLDDYSDPNAQDCSYIEANKDPTDNSTNELRCNNNHNCKWNNVPPSCSTTEVPACAGATSDQATCESAGACTFTAVSGGANTCVTSEVAECVAAGTDPTACGASGACTFNGASSSCVNNDDCGDGGRFTLPIIDAINSTESLNDSLDLHNKVVRSGIDYVSSSNTYPDNLYPCNDVVFSNSLKIQAKNDISTPGKLISEMDDWINHFELKRDECSDKMGQCYLKDYVCENSNGYPIPLKNLQLGSDSDFTIGAMNDGGCQQALYPCGDSDLNNNCLTIEEDATGYITETTDGGLCKGVFWNPSINTWELADGGNPSDLPVSNKCIPAPGGTLSNLNTVRFPDAKISNWINNNEDVTTRCKAVNKIPRSNIDDDVTINNYYRWSSVSSNGNNLCSDWITTNTCPNSKIINNNASYRNNETPEIECCMDSISTSGPINLYVTGELVAGSTPNLIVGVTPTLVDDP
jgi:hypothetical protein